MMNKIFLDKTDVQQIIANYYDVDLKAVNLHLFNTTKGYGMDEHDEAEIEVIITKKGR